MESYVITLTEHEAMHGLPPIAHRIYLVLRRFVDLKTGIVGLARRVSYKCLKEECEHHIQRGRGIQTITPTDKAIEMALANLRRKGLIDPTGDLMVYRLPLAQLSGAARAFSRPQNTGGGNGETKPRQTPVYKLLPGNTGYRQNGQKRGTSVQGFAAKSIAAHLPQPAAQTIPTPAPVSKEAAAALGWMEKHSNGYRVAKPNHANVEKYEQLFRAGPEAVATATHTAAARRAAENSAAPLQPGLVVACLPKGCFIPKPPPLAARTASQSTPRPEIPPLVIDEAAVARGNTLMARFAAKRSHSEVRA
jgi:hypothetical protein